MSQSFYPLLPYNLIQSIRLAHALMETSYNLVILPEDEAKFSILKQKFGINYSVSEQPCLTLSGLTIVHQEPRTQVGNITRPLLFPQQILVYCRELWAVKREHRITFAGLLTEQRRAILKQIIERNYETSINFEDLSRPNLFSKIQKKLWQVLAKQPTSQLIKWQYKDLYFWSSNRGRNFPIKSWDDSYFKLLANSEFVLCPNGDYVWTYRFFESIMCGAIPIVEESCPAYEGFSYRTIKENFNQMIWSQEEAEYNYQLCLERLTVPTTVLEDEIERLISEQSKQTQLI